MIIYYISVFDKIKVSLLKNELIIIKLDNIIDTYEFNVKIE